MLTYAKLKNKPRVFKSLIGISLSEFEELLPSFEKAWQDEIYRNYVTRKGRKRNYGGGRKAQLQDSRDKLLFILFYFRQYPTQEVQGFLFGIGQPQANDWVHRLTKILNQALGEEQQLPERNPRKLEQVLAECADLEFIIDGTERPINRPKDSAKRDEHYSGKKKGTTVKNNVLTERRTGGKVKYLSRTVEGKKHDKKLADEDGHQFPPGSKLWQDTGFQGYQPENVTIFQPKKKPRGGELTAAEKECNREIFSQRIPVEHHIEGIKRSRIVHDTFRNQKDDFVDIVMETACGLHNFRVSQRQVVAA